MKWILLALLAFRCVETPPPLPPAPMTDAGAIDMRTSCKKACERLRSLGCPEGSPSGDTCEAICENAETSGVTSVHPDCLANIASCDQIDAC